jgi:hypothetical protein
MSEHHDEAGAEESPRGGKRKEHRVKAERGADGVAEPFAEAVRTYVEGVEEAVREGNRHAAGAARGLVQTLQEQPETPEGGAQELYSAYPRLVKESQQRLQDAYRAYQLELQEAGEETRAGIEQAFRGYVAGLQKAWASIDPEQIDLSTIAAINQSIVAAAWGIPRWSSR